MKLLLSLDYELFFGPRTGSVENCLLRPAAALAELAARYGLKLSFFVDAGFLARLSAQQSKYPRLGRELDAIRRQLASFVKAGHDIQLHVHPHWEDSFHTGDSWLIDTARYRLHDFSPAEQQGIVRKYRGVLADIAGSPIFAFRAGGWCLQPFEAIGRALAGEDVWLDSTVFSGGVSADRTRRFDFSSAPEKACWRFSADPCVEDENGGFVELPITSFRCGRLLFWKMALLRRMRPGNYRPFGDGAPMVAAAGYYLQRLFFSTRSVVSLDGLKAGELRKAFAQFRERPGPEQLFHVMGHPKALSRYSLREFARFLDRHAGFTPVTFQDFRRLRPENKQDSLVVGR